MDQLIMDPKSSLQSPANTLKGSVHNLLAVNGIVQCLPEFYIIQRLFIHIYIQEVGS